MCLYVINKYENGKNLVFCLFCFVLVPALTDFLRGDRFFKGWLPKCLKCLK